MIPKWVKLLCIAVMLIGLWSYVAPHSRAAGLLSGSMTRARLTAPSERDSILQAKRPPATQLFRARQTQTTVALGSGPRSSDTLVVSVDGKKTPQLVPDAFAYKLYLKTLAMGDSPSVQERGKHQAILKTLRLSDTDLGEIAPVLTGLGRALDAIRAERRRIDASGTAVQSATTLIELTNREDSALQSAVQDVLNNLSIDGRKRLDAHIQNRVKQHIVMFSASGHQHQ
jgi:hypothetical protein